MKNTNDILQRMKLLMKYDTKKTLNENKRLILEETKYCSSLEDFFKNRDCFYLKKGEVFDNPYIPSEMYKSIEYGTLKAINYRRQQDVRVGYREGYKLPTIKVSVFKENEDVVRKLQDLLGVGQITKYERKSRPGLEYLGLEKDYLNSRNESFGYDEAFDMNQGNSNVIYLKDLVSDETIKKVFSLLDFTEYKDIKSDESGYSREYDPNAQTNVKDTKSKTDDSKSELNKNTATDGTTNSNVKDSKPIGTDSKSELNKNTTTDNNTNSNGKDNGKDLYSTKKGDVSGSSNDNNLEKQPSDKPSTPVVGTEEPKNKDKKPPVITQPGASSSENDKGTGFSFFLGL